MNPCDPEIMISRKRWANSGLHQFSSVLAMYLVDSLIDRSWAEPDYFPPPCPIIINYPGRGDDPFPKTPIDLKIRAATDLPELFKEHWDVEVQTFEDGGFIAKFLAKQPKCNYFEYYKGFSEGMDLDILEEQGLLEDWERFGKLIMSYLDTLNFNKMEVTEACPLRPKFVFEDEKVTGWVVSIELPFLETVIFKQRVGDTGCVVCSTLDTKESFVFTNENEADGT